MSKLRLRNRLFLLAVSLVIQVLFGSCAYATSRIFVLDSSASMLKAELFERIKQTIREDYIPQLSPGDHIIVLAFDEKVNIVVDQAVVGPEDLQAITKTIDRLEARGPWTWLSKALVVTNTQAARLKAQYPNEPLHIYLLTDGVNDPPPTIGEPMLRFVEVLSKYFGEFTMKDSYVYVLVFREEGEVPAVTPEESDTLSKKTEGRVVVEPVVPTARNLIPPEVYLGYADTDLGTLDLAEGESPEPITLLIKDGVGEIRGREIELTCRREVFPSFLEFAVEPNIITIERIGQMAKPIIRLPADLPPGDYAATLRLSCPGVLLSPTNISIRFCIVESGSAAAGGKMVFAVLGVLAVLSGVYAVYLRGRRMTVLVREPDKKEGHEIIVRGLKPSSLTVVGLAEFSLLLGRYPQELRSLFLRKDHTVVQKVELGETIACETSTGSKSIVIEKPKPHPPKEAEEKAPLEKRKSPDFFTEPASSSDPDSKFHSDIEPKE